VSITTSRRSFIGGTKVHFETCRVPNIIYESVFGFVEEDVHLNEAVSCFPCFIFGKWICISPQLLLHNH
jgi:hypothetical protein